MSPRKSSPAPLRGDGQKAVYSLHRRRSTYPDPVQARSYESYRITGFAIECSCSTYDYNVMVASYLSTVSQKLAWY